MQRALPVMNGHRPLLTNLMQGQIEQLEDRLLTGKQTAILNYLTQGVVNDSIAIVV